MCFAAEILRRGWRVSRPYGDSAPYDCIVDADEQLSRVQVRSAGVHKGVGRFETRFHIVVAGRTKKREHETRKYDILAALVVPHRTWYIIPIAATKGQIAISLWPLRPSLGKLEHFREAWELLRGGELEPKNSDSFRVEQTFRHSTENTDDDGL